MKVCVEHRESPMGISFNVESGRITIHKNTLAAMNYPEYYHFLFSPEDKFLAIEPCGMNDDGAHQLLELKNRKCFEIKCINLVRFIYRTCNWDNRVSYRCFGRKPDPDSKRVYFDLLQACAIHEKRKENVVDSEESNIF